MYRSEFEGEEVYSHLPPRSGGNIISDVISSITGDTMKTAAEAAGKAAVEGVVDGTKITMSEGVKRAGKKMTTKMIGEGKGISERPKNPANKGEIQEHSREFFKELEDEKEELTKFEEEVLSFFGK